MARNREAGMCDSCIYVMHLFSLGAVCVFVFFFPLSPSTGQKSARFLVLQAILLKLLRASCVTSQEMGADCSVGMCSYVSGWGSAYFRARKYVNKRIP